MTTDTTLPVTFDCSQNRHKVITEDPTCVICGARNVKDARTLTPIPIKQPGAAPIGPGAGDRVRRLAHRLITDRAYRADHLAGILVTEDDAGAELVREILRRFDTR